MLLKSPAKINLFLHIQGKAANNYHYLESLFYRIDNLYDEIEITENDENSIKTSNFYVAQSENILQKCLDLLQKRYNFMQKFKITINKRIPLGSGLGGGSSNAAVFLRFVSEKYQIPLKQTDLLDIGADVAFFYSGYKLALCSGFGEQVVPVENQRLSQILKNIMIVCPSIQVSTAEVYKHLRFTCPTAYKLEDMRSWKNDLLAPALNISPQINSILELLRANPSVIYSNMSGSGSACFAIFGDNANLSRLKQTLLDMDCVFFLD